MRKLIAVLVLLIAGVYSFANGFKCQDNYNGKIEEKDFGELFVYHIGNIAIQGQFNDNGTISYFVNDVFVVDGYDYKIDDYTFYTSRGCFYFGKDGNTLGDSFYVEPVFDDVNPFDVDVNPFEN